MSTPLADQIRDYFGDADRQQGCIDIDAVMRASHDIGLMLEVSSPPSEGPTSPRRWLILAVAAATVVAVVVGALVLAARNDSTEPNTPAAPPTSATATTQDLGVFEPVRGWIIYPIRQRLEAVNPNDRWSRRILELPAEALADLPDHANVAPAGWSADGSRLALDNEYGGHSFVMDSTGAISTVSGRPSGCCGFGTNAWLSPDGTTTFELGPQELRLISVDEGTTSQSVPLSPGPEDAGRDWGMSPVPAWSPDGSQIAYAVYKADGAELVPSVYVIDLDTETTHQLIGPSFGFIRQMAWSPDGSQLLLIAGPWRHPTTVPALNPWASPIETSLYLIDSDGSTPREIARGHYVVAAWSPDGRQIAAIDFAESRQVVVMNNDGTRLRALVDLPREELFTGLAWHPIPDE